VCKYKQKLFPTAKCFGRVPQSVILAQTAFGSLRRHFLLRAGLSALSFSVAAAPPPLLKKDAASIPHARAVFPDHPDSQNY